MNVRHGHNEKHVLTINSERNLNTITAACMKNELKTFHISSVT